MSLTNPMKVLLAAIVIAIIGLGFWILDWQGKQQTLSQMEQTLKDKSAERDRMQNDVKKIDTLLQENNQLKADLKTVMEAGILPENPQEFVANYLIQISSLVDRVKNEDNDPDFALLSLTPGSQVNSQVAIPGAKPGAAPSGAPSGAPDKPAPVPEALKSYPTRTFQMSMKGRYETLIDFLDRLGALELQRLVTVNKLSLSPAGPVDKGGSPVLSITMPLTAYLRTGGGDQQ
jgi:Tfp pilus assembly protein PilO